MDVPRDPQPLHVVHLTAEMAPIAKASPTWSTAAQHCSATHVHRTARHMTRLIVWPPSRTSSCGMGLPSFFTQTRVVHALASPPMPT